MSIRCLAGSVALLLSVQVAPAQDQEYPEQFNLETTEHLYQLCTVEEDDEHFELAAGLCLGFIGGVLTANPDVHLGDAPKKKTKSRAGQGAKRGAAAGAASGFLWGLISGGDPLERAAQSAAVGATAGAVSGSMSKQAVKQPKVCIDKETTLLEAGQQFVLWAESNRKGRKKPPQEGVMMAAEAGWPCE